ncbi:class I SAM-dependent methyltransferase [Nitratireductor sp. XY-223]|uniref:class I SAM-dependent methyltransferase n=1 Tax=Nitratireductor sp. XY-223 TaxID=2561926 RepID=UPI0010AA5AAB|nr:class I SAM-dependent methyltransferase [Nitratireductor sp. XY-223]
MRHIRAMSLYHTYSLLWDRKFEGMEQIATRGTVFPDQLSPVNSAHANLTYEYGPSPRPVVEWLLKALKVDFSQYSFVDIGSGRGRVLLTAATKPFKQVHGVEFCSVLHEQASRNIAGYPGERLQCRDVQSILCDALDYEVPEGNCVLYFFNPFDVQLVERVVTKFLDSAARNGNRVIVIYYNSKVPELLSGDRRLAFRPLSKLCRLRLKLFSPHPVQVYERVVGEA